ncbi:Copper chaperone CopZ [compost metagenome]
MNAEVKLYLNGLYCGECKDVITMALRNTTGVIKAEVSYARAFAVVTYDDDLTDVNQIIGAIERVGYGATSNKKNVWKRHLFTLAIIAVLIILFTNLFGHGMELSVYEGMSYGLIFIVGLTASFHCVGMCGGIMLSQTIAPDKRMNSNNLKAFVPAAAYNIGRMISYTLVGAIVGAIGSVISVKASFKGGVLIVIGVLMTVMALQMMHIIPRFEKIPFRLPQSCVLPQSLKKKYAAKPLIVGLLTGLMPCGQLQTMQLYALGTGSAAAGATVMFAFSAGTVPLMFLLGGVSAYFSRKYQKYMLRISGITISSLSILLIMMGFSLLFAGSHIHHH